METPTNEYDDQFEKLKYESYLGERTALVDAEREGAQSFDKSILTLSTGAFGLSLAFMKDVTPNLREGTELVLSIAWFLFVVSILSTLVSFLTSQRACREQRDILEAEFFEPEDQSRNNKNVFGIWTNRLNKVSIFFFIFGAISLSVFSSMNISS